MDTKRQEICQHDSELLYRINTGQRKNAKVRELSQKILKINYYTSLSSVTVLGKLRMEHKSPGAVLT